MFGWRRQRRFGSFEVVSVVPYDVSDGVRTLRLSGRLVDLVGGGPIETVTAVFGRADRDPAVGDRLPASWDPARPGRVRVQWREQYRAAPARSERDRRAAALGVDPALPVPDLPMPTGATGVLYWSSDAAPLPDGSAPVGVEEATRLRRTGEAAEAVVMAVDPLRRTPGASYPRGASIANVALQVQRASGEYRALARFGFATDGRRRQVAVGARIPVRLDPAAPSRIALDPARLPVP